jgi:hypothetical protein
VKIVQIHQIDIVVVSDPIACKRPQSKPAINDSGMVSLVNIKNIMFLLSLLLLIHFSRRKNVE